MTEDIRWKQRFDNYNRALHQLTQDMLSKLVGMFEESNLPYQVDLSILKDIDNPSLQEHIERVGKVLYERRGTCTAGPVAVYDRVKLGS